MYKRFGYYSNHHQCESENKHMCLFSLSTNVSVITQTIISVKVKINTCVYFHFHTDDGLSNNRNVCTYCYAHKIMKFITFALVFSFILCCWPKTNIIKVIYGHQGPPTL